MDQQGNQDNINLDELSVFELRALKRERERYLAALKERTRRLEEEHARLQSQSKEKK